MDYERIFVIGDIHGRYDKLSSVFNKIHFNEDKDYLILLGDYTDRGNENVHCLQWAMKMSEKPNVMALRGNHEQMMLYYYLVRDYQSTIWLPNGGNLTKREIDEWNKTDPTFLKKALTFIYECPMYHRMFIDGQEYIFCHAGLKDGIPLEEQPEEALIWIREEFFNNYTGTAHVVVGHTPTPYIGTIRGMENRDPYYPIHLPNNITMLDTGSFLPQGRISCIEIRSGQIWQSDPVKDPPKTSWLNLFK